MAVNTETTTEHRYVLQATGELLPRGFKPSAHPRIDVDLEENPFPTWAGQPTLSRAFLKHDEAVFARDGSGLVPMSVKELVRIRTARVINCKICSNTRNATARSQGVTEDILDKVTDDHESSDLSEAQKVALSYADAVLFATAPSDELKQGMLRHFTPEQIVELTVFVSQCRTFASIGIALGIQPDEMPEIWVH
jgi:alkylhydroperoxidase family enzyme